MNSIMKNIEPPYNFCYYEDTVCRCTYPLKERHIAYLRQLSIESIINLTGTEFKVEVVNEIQKHGFILVG